MAKASCRLLECRLRIQRLVEPHSNRPLHSGSVMHIDAVRSGLRRPRRRRSVATFGTRSTSFSEGTHVPPAVLARASRPSANRRCTARTSGGLGRAGSGLSASFEDTRLSVLCESVGRGLLLERLSPVARGGRQGER